MERGHTEDPEPQDRERHRQAEDAKDELADGAAAANAGDEDADERRPRDGPCPVEDRPRVLPRGQIIIGREDVVPQRQLRQARDVHAQRLDRALEQEQGGAGDQDEDQQRDRHDDVGVGQSLDALLQAQGHGDAGDRGDDRDGEHLHVRRHRYAEQLIEAGVDLQRAQAHRGRHTKDRADEGHDVDCLADRTEHLVTQQRGEDRAQARRHLALVDEVGERERRQREDRPRVQAEVVQRERHRLLRGVHRPGLDVAARWVGEVRDGFGYAPEHKDRADARREQHREPGQRGVFRHLVVATQPDVAEATHGYPNEETQERGDAQNVEPTQIGHDPPGGGAKDGSYPVTKQKGDHDKGEDDPHRREEHSRVGLESQCSHDPFGHGLPRRIGSGVVALIFRDERTLARISTRSCVPRKLCRRRRRCPFQPNGNPRQAGSRCGRVSSSTDPPDTPGHSRFRRRQCSRHSRD